MLPPTDLTRIRELCDARVPQEQREHVRVELEQERQAVNIVERRPPWREDYGPGWSRLPIARLRYVASKRLWTLYYHRHTGRWERYPLLGPSRRLDDLLGELAEPRSVARDADRHDRLWSNPIVRPLLIAAIPGSPKHWPEPNVDTVRRESDRAVDFVHVIGNVALQ